MTIKDLQRSRCVELMAELGKASAKSKESSSEELENFVAKLLITLLRNCLGLRVKLTLCGVN